MAENFNAFSVYSIRHSSELERWHSDPEGRGEFTIRQSWTGAKALVERGPTVPILFSLAQDTTYIEGWGRLQDVSIDAGVTTVTVTGFRLLAEDDVFRKDDLIKRSDGLPLDMKFIRPYAIVRTPPGLSEMTLTSGAIPDMGEEETFVEGAPIEILVNSYERDPRVRAACIAHHGFACVVCDMSFERTYGKDAARVIHVHHLDPIRRGARETDPINDLVPVCPNCHAVIHLKSPPHDVESVKKMLAASASEEP